MTYCHRLEPIVPLSSSTNHIFLSLIGRVSSTGEPNTRIHSEKHGNAAESIQIDQNVVLGPSRVGPGRSTAFDRGIWMTSSTNAQSYCLVWKFTSFDLGRFGIGILEAEEVSEKFLPDLGRSDTFKNRSDLRFWNLEPSIHYIMILPNPE